MQQVVHVSEPSDHPFGAFLLTFSVRPPFEIVPLDGGTQNNAFRIVRQNADHLVMIQYGPKAMDHNVSATLACMNQLSILGLPVPRILGNKDNLLVQPISASDAETMGTVMTFLPGEPLSKDAPDQLTTLAGALANMHLHTKSLHSIPPNPFPMDGLGPLFESIDLKDINKSHAAILHNGIKRLEKADFSPLPKGFIHGDLFADNCMFYGNNLTGIIDFELCGRDVLAYDIAITLLGCIYSQNPYRHWQPLEDLFIQAYHEVRPLDKAEIEALSLLKIAAAVRFSLTRIMDELAGSAKRPSRDMIEILTLLN